VTLLDASALLDPLAGGFHHFFQVSVGKQPWRNVRPQGRNFCPHKICQIEFSKVRKNKQLL
jgi:hypothetical protein